MPAPTGKLKYAYQTIANMESKINAHKEREAIILDAIKKCFPHPCCTEGFQLVKDCDYNKLVSIINNKDR